jgi:uncharacterized membrane-anchored protein
MCTSFETLCSKVSLKSAAVFALLPIFVFLGISRSNAQQSSLLSLASPDQGQVSWTSGPADASLGTLADIKIPKGYRFTDAAGAGVLLTKMNNPVPEGLVGILAPESGEWWVVLTYKDVGYIKGVDKDQIVAAAILKTISDRAQRQNESRRLHGLPSITSVDWALSPAYDAKTHAVEWSVRAKTRSSEVINHTVRLLGREGVLDATAVAPYQQSRDTSAAIPLKELMRNISFKQGQRYADHQEGDKVSNMGLAGVITGDEDTATAQNDEVAASGKSAGGWVWYVLAGVVVGGTFMLVRGVVHRHHKTSRRTHSSGSAASHAVGNGNAISNGNGHVHAPVEVASPKPAMTGSVATGEPAQDDLKPKMTVAQDGSNGSAHRRNARRKKIFDYHRFYTDTVMKLSASGYTVEVPPRNGHTNGHANGHSSDLTNEAKSASYGTMNQTIMQSHLELIANQKALIEEQKRLVQQQTRFIEEKNKLIQEQNTLLERQSAMIENQYSLKLESES